MHTVWEDAVKQATGERDYLNCTSRIAAPGWLHLERQNTFLPLPGCHTEGSCFCFCFPQPTGKDSISPSPLCVSHHFLTLINALLDNFLTVLPHKELFSTDDTSNGSVVDYGKREKNEHSEFMCLHPWVYRLYFIRRSLIFMLDSCLQYNSLEMRWEGKQINSIWLASI